MPARISKRASAPRRVLLAALLAALFIPTTSHAVTNGNSCSGTPDKASAQALSPQGACYGDLQVLSTASHWFKFEFPAPAALGIRMDRGGARAILSGPGGVLPPTVGPGSGDPDQSEWHYRLPAGNYYFEVRARDSFQTVVAGDYVFVYRYETQNDCGSGGDAGNTPATAAAGSLNNACTARIWGNEFHSGAYKDSEDWYAVSLNQGETFEAAIAGYMDPTDGCGPSVASISCGDIIIPTLSVELRNSKGVLVPEATPGSATTPLQYPVAATGTYYVRVSGAVDDIYNLTMTTSVAVPNVNNLTNIADSCGGPDAGNTSATAAQIGAAFQACYGTLTPDTDKADWFKFEVSGAETTAQNITFQMDADATQGQSFEIIDPSNVVVFSGATGLGIPGYTPAGATLAKSGTWKLRVFLGEFNTAPGNYEFTLDVRNLLTVGVPSNLPTTIPTIPTINGLETLNNDTCPYPGTTDAGNDKNHAAPIYSSNPYCYGALNRTSGDTVDYYKFDATANDKFYFTLSGDGSLDPTIEIRRPNGSLWSEFTPGGGLIPEYAAGSNLDATGTWSVKISPATPGSVGSYVFLFYWSSLTNNIGVPSNLPTVVPTIPNIGVNVLSDDCFGSGDAGNGRKTARAISSQTMCTGSMAISSPTDTQDWYSFPGQAGQSVIVGVTGDGNLDPTLSLFLPSGARVTSYPNSSPIPDYIRYDMTQNGTYIIAITRANYTSGHYGLMVDVPNQVGGVPFVPSSIPSVTPTVPSISGDCGQGGDAPNTRTRYISKQPAQDYSPNSSCVGSLGGNDVDDWYQFGGTAGQHFNLALSSSYSLDADVFLIDPRGFVRLKLGNGGLLPESLNNYILDRTGTWKFKIVKAYGGGDYSLSSSLQNS